MAEDEKSIAIVDILQGTKDKQMSVDFFMSLLNDLSKIMAEKVGEPETQGAEVAPHVGAPNLNEVTSLLSEQVLDECSDNKERMANVEKKLLQLDQDLEDTMRTLKRNLMVIRLLGLMSEDDKLQEALMKDSEQLIQFVGLTLERGALACQRRKQNQDEEQDDDFGSNMMEVTMY